MGDFEWAELAPRDKKALCSNIFSNPLWYVDGELDFDQLKGRLNVSHKDLHRYHSAWLKAGNEVPRTDPVIEMLTEILERLERLENMMRVNEATRMMKEE